MLTDPKLRSQVDSLWDKLWTGGLSNPLDAIEQLSYLIFLKRLDDRENATERQATRREERYMSRVPAEMRWGHWTQLEAGKALTHLRDVVFPWLRELGAEGSSFERYMGNAELKINKPALLIEACKLIEGMQIASQNRDVQGDLYEYLLDRLSIAGRNGQFRTPRHIVRMMVQMIDPQPYERVGDLTGGTCGFGVNAYQHVLEHATSPEVLAYDADGWAHNLVGDLLTAEQRAFLQTKFFRAFDNDSGMTMLRIGSMNLMLHGIESPRFFYMDTLSEAFSDTREYDVILMNPPFKGAVDKADVNPTLPGNTTKSELLFLHLILRALEMGGRYAVIVPDGVLFGSSTAHVEIRCKLVEENRLDGIVSMPGGVFKPYAGVSTAVLLFTRGAQTGRIWFYDTQEHITQEAIHSSATKLVPTGSLLVVVKGKVLMHRLPVAMTRVPLCHGQDIKSIQCSPKIDPYFAVYVLKHNEPRLLSQARGANTGGLTLPMLQEIPVPDAGLAQQCQFAQIVQRFDRVRTQQREALRQAEQLFGALLGRAFRGEL